MSRDTNNSALQKHHLSKFYSLNSDPASFADGDMNLFKQGSWRLLVKTFQDTAGLYALVLLAEVDRRLPTSLVRSHHDLADIHKRETRLA